MLKTRGGFRENLCGEVRQSVRPPPGRIQEASSAGDYSALCLRRGKNCSRHTCQLNKVLTCDTVFAQWLEVSLGLRRCSRCAGAGLAGPHSPKARHLPFPVDTNRTSIGRWSLMHHFQSCHDLHGASKRGRGFSLTFYLCLPPSSLGISMCFLPKADCLRLGRRSSTCSPIPGSHLIANASCHAPVTLYFDDFRLGYASSWVPATERAGRIERLIREIGIV